MEVNNTLNCLIIEDEPIAADVLKDYVEQVSFLDLKGICTDAIFALDRLNNESIDVIFLDIHLPKLKGLDFLRTLKKKPQTILTTAYHQYALEAFEEDVVDYLMKPIEFSRFLKAVNKLQKKENTISTSNSSAVEDLKPFHFFNVNKKMVKVFIDDILFIESLKDYSRIVTSTDTLVTKGQIGEFEEAFRTYNFLRIHRSYVIPFDKIKSFSATEIEVGGKALPIGRTYKELVIGKLKRGWLD